MLETAKSIARELVPVTEVGQTHVVEAFPQLDKGACTTEGLYRNGLVYIKRSCLTPADDTSQAEITAMAKATGILIHERLHGRGFLDETAQFEYEMTTLIGQLAIKLAA